MPPSALLSIVHQKKLVCQASLLSGRNVRWPRRMLLPGESRWVRWLDRRTVTLRFLLDAASVKNRIRRTLSLPYIRRNNSSLYHRDQRCNLYQDVAYAMFSCERKTRLWWTSNTSPAVSESISERWEQWCEVTGEDNTRQSDECRYETTVIDT